jgi:hypothetical protein
VEARFDVPGFHTGDEGGLRGLSLWRSVVVTLVIRKGLFRAIEFQNRSDPNLPDALLGLRLLAGVFPAAKLPFDLNMCALRQRFGKVGELPEDHATVPLCLRNVLVAVLVLVGRFGSYRKRGEAAVVGVANFCIVTQEADEGDFVLIHDVVSIC